MECPNCNIEIIDDAEEEYKLNLEDRKILIDAARESARTFDKAILTITSGAFGLSFIFLKEIVPTPNKSSFHLLAFSWLFFAVSLVIILFAFLASQNACIYQSKLNFLKKSEKEKKKNWWSTITLFCNYVSIITLAIAILFMGSFFYTNVIVKNRMEVSMKEKPKRIDESFVQKETPKAFVPPDRPSPPPAHKPPPPPVEPPQKPSSEPKKN